MHKPTFCLITPSYKPDFERCRLLCNSIERFIHPPVTHYIIVDEHDLKLFKQLENSKTEILTKESILPWWIKRIPFNRNNIWISLRTLPIRGWLIQQIIKIAMAQYVKEDVLVFVDSDVAFIRPFDFQNLVKGDKVRFYYKPNSIPIDMEQGHFKWYETASCLLKVPPIQFPAPDYINQIVTWRRENVLKLCHVLEENFGRHWIEILGNSWHLSEYVLYGTFIEQNLGLEAGHYYEDWDICHNHFSESPLSDDELDHFFSTVSANQIAVMISAKAGMPTSRYASYVMDSQSQLSR